MHSGLANKKTVTIQVADKEKDVVVGTTKTKKQNKLKLYVNKSVLKKEFPRMPKLLATSSKLLCKLTGDTVNKTRNIFGSISMDAASSINLRRRNERKEEMTQSEFDHTDRGDALYAMELALSLEKLVNEKLLNLHSGLNIRGCSSSTSSSGESMITPDFGTENNAVEYLVFFAVIRTR